ncbi:MAG: Archaeal Lon protease [Candidatus Methanofastidiosum methylothiophilum]|uniref:Archaeal Lon protease n=1 Tax=Candidatus Methanofastidiosum methylothiophilum TaxID=1705564 RepID=A0A150IR59_9EURY|nr:MAG: Archaeal Lon protease [Candidatus Methanofastidiosum methylthiophilus]KYC47325.1 MAG: Archaeal Lon protease [Candidatus Methanofastidiosum methylthiophilus]KYC49776.1 MAG: Archaeal Lon protease [Candidatus Methanofastidiosum methylthiophilus]
MNKKILAIFLLSILFTGLLPALLSQEENGKSITIKVPAVKRTSSGLEGSVFDATVLVRPGTGRVFVDTWPLSELDTQASCRFASVVASDILKVPHSKYDYFYTIRADSPIIGGPSAGAALTIATIASIQGLDIDPTVMMTGMINPDGTVGPVGGILEKIMGANSTGTKIFLIPSGQSVIQIIEEGKIDTVNVIEHAKNRWGITVIEVDDAVDALWYFTGYRIKEDKPPSKVIVNTDFIKDRALSEFVSVEKLSKSTTTKLNSESIGYREYQTLTDFLNRANSNIDTAKKNLSEKRYYSAMSNIFNAKIQLNYISDSIDVMVNRDSNIVKAKIETAQKELDEANELIAKESSNIRGITSFECLAAAEKRAIESENLIADAWRHFYNQRYYDAIYYANFAQERAKTAKLWLDVSKENSKGEATIEESQIKYNASQRIEDARLSLVYARTLIGQNSLLTQSAELLAAAEREYENGKYAAAIFDAIDSKVRSSVSIELWSSGEDVIKQRLERAKDQAGGAIFLARRSGGEPIMAESYYEYASTFEESDKIGAIILYKYSKGVAFALRFLEPLEEISTQKEVQIEKSQTLVTTKSYNYVAYFIGGLLIGLIIGGIAVFYTKREIYR